MSERELAAAVVAWLADGWDVYQEVTGRCGVADIVAVDTEPPRRVWIIECKASFSLAVLAQAWHWIKAGAAHRVSVAVPQGGNWKARTFTEAVADQFGIGVIYVSGHRPPTVSERRAPTLRRRICAPVKVCEEQKTECKAGSQGGHWTAFRGTCKAALRFVRDNPGCTATELVHGIEHHYATPASARSSLLQWARAGKLKGVRVDSEKRPARFRLVTT